ncbi:MAG: Lrp/AsnC family transcriptional regulator [Bacillota bacterium]
MKLSSEDKQIIRALQEDLPDTIRPYEILAKKLEMSENSLLEKVSLFLEKGILRRLGGVVRHQKVGYKHNMMVVWRVPGQLVSSIGKKMASYPEITHCYERSTLPQWPYNLFTMVHGTSREACESFIKKLSRENTLDDYQILTSIKELKKTSMKYFV